MSTTDDPRVDPGTTLDEKPMLEAFLDWYRVAVERKLEGLDRGAAVHRHVKSSSTLAGVVKHLAYVERGWFREGIAGEQGLPHPWTDQDPSADFRLDADETVESVVAFYRSEQQRSREILAGRSLDEVVTRRGTDFTVRWIVIHMVEETARHAGHMDILRELTDGTTGE